MTDRAGGSETEEMQVRGITMKQQGQEAAGGPGEPQGEAGPVRLGTGLRTAGTRRVGGSRGL